MARSWWRQTPQQTDWLRALGGYAASSGSSLGAWAGSSSGTWSVLVTVGLPPPKRVRSTADRASQGGPQVPQDGEDSPRNSPAHQRPKAPRLLTSSRAESYSPIRSLEWLRHGGRLVEAEEEEFAAMVRAGFAPGPCCGPRRVCAPERLKRCAPCRLELLSGAGPLLRRRPRGGRVVERLRRVRTRHEERALPHYDEAERAILGAVLLDNQAFNTATQILTPDDFFGEANRLIYEAMAGLSERSEPIDTVTVRTELTQCGALERAGGPAYICSLTDGIPAATNVAAYARIVREASRCRQLARLGQGLGRCPRAGNRPCRSDRPTAREPRTGRCIRRSRHATRCDLTGMAGGPRTAACLENPRLATAGKPSDRLCPVQGREDAAGGQCRTIARRWGRLSRRAPSGPRSRVAGTAGLRDGATTASRVAR